MRINLGISARLCEGDIMPECIEELPKCVDEDNMVDVIYLDFSKAYNQFPH